MADMTSNYAIIVPHYEDHVRLRRCLDALAQNDLSDTEVVVVDNKSPTSLDDIERAFPKFRFVIEERKGAAAARNRGVLETRSPFIVFLDADCVPSADWVDVAKRCAVENQVTGGRITVFDEGSGPRTGAQAFETVFAFNQADYIANKGFSVTANLVTSRAVFERTGPMIVGVSEDLEWCQRAVQKGAKLIYEDALVVAHPTRSDWPALRKKWTRMTSEGFELFAERKGKALWLARAAALPLSVLAHTPKILKNNDLSESRDKWLAFTTLARLRFSRAFWMIKQVFGLPIND